MASADAFQHFQRHFTRRLQGQIFAAEAGADGHVFQHRHVLQRLHNLVGARQPKVDDLVGRTIGDVLTGKLYRSFVSLVHAVHHVEQRGLAGAVGAYQPQNLAFAEAEAHIGDRQQSAKPFAYAAHFQQGSHSITLRARGTRR